MIATIVICTFNRASLLRQCLSSLALLSADRSIYEIIVVDNGSKDDTETVVGEFTNQFAEFRYLRENTVGLSHARNLGFRNARGDYVVYFDDDCKVPPHWVTRAQEIINARNPAAFGGPYFPFYMTPKPPWFKDQYASWVLSEEARPLLPNEYLTGLNMAIQRSLLEELGGFDTNLGMAGKNMGYAEETELFQRLRLKAPEKEVYYDRQLYVHHLVRANKMTLRWRIRHYYMLGKYWGRTSLDPAVLEQPNNFRELYKNAIGLVKESIKGIVWRDKTSFPYFQNYLLENSFHYLYALGIWVGKQQRSDSSSRKQTSQPQINTDVR